MPLDQDQIEQYRRRADQRDKSLAPASPDLRTRTVRVSLEPGATPATVHTTANIATALVFHDSTGQAWPVSSVTNGGAGFFNLLRPDVPEGNLINVVPAQNYASAAIVVTLEGRDVPLIIRLVSDGTKAPERGADGLVLFQLNHSGPKATPPVIANIKDTVSSAMLAFLDSSPPQGARRLRIQPGSPDTTAWQYNGLVYLRTKDKVISPAWRAVVNGAGGVSCFEFPPTSRVLLSRDGQVSTVQVIGIQKGDE